MSRLSSTDQCIDQARQLFKSARTAQELRLAQAVLLPLEMGLSLSQTAQAIGRSKTATSNMRARFVQVSLGVRPAPRTKHQLRNRAKFDLQRESQVLDEVFTNMGSDGVGVVIPQIKPLIEEKLGMSVSLSTLYRMLARHGWRKRPAEGRPPTHQVWEKNSPVNHK